MWQRQSYFLVHLAHKALMSFSFTVLPGCSAGNVHEFCSSEKKKKLNLLLWLLFKETIKQGVLKELH